MYPGEPFACNPDTVAFAIKHHFKALKIVEKQDKREWR